MATFNSTDLLPVRRGTTTYKATFQDLSDNILAGVPTTGLQYYGPVNLKVAPAGPAIPIAENDVIRLGADFVAGTDAIDAGWGITTPNPMGLLTGQTLKANELLLLTGAGFVRFGSQSGGGTATTTTFFYRGVLDVAKPKPAGQAVLTDKQAFTVAADGLAGATVHGSWGAISGVAADAGDLVINQAGILSVMASAAAPPGTIPPATRTSLGGVKVGGDLKVAADGTLSIDFNPDTFTDALGTTPITVRLDPAGGIVAPAGGAGLALSKPTTTQPGGVSVPADSAISINNTTSAIDVEVDNISIKKDLTQGGRLKVNPGPGLEIAATGLAVKLGKGLQADGTGRAEVKLASNGGLVFDATGQLALGNFAGLDNLG